MLFPDKIYIHYARFKDCTDIGCCIGAAVCRHTIPGVTNLFMLDEFTDVQVKKYLSNICGCCEERGTGNREANTLPGPFGGMKMQRLFPINLNNQSYGKVIPIFSISCRPSFTHRCNQTFVDFYLYYG